LVKTRLSHVDLEVVSGGPGEFGGDLDLARTPARRWPWLVPVLLLLVAALKYGLTAAVHMISFDSTDDATYTRWVSSPIAAGDLGTAALLAATGVLLCLRRWRPRERTAILAGASVLVLICVLLGVQASNPRRHVGPNLLAAVALVPVPIDAVTLHAAQLDDSGVASDGTLPMPTAGRSWTMPTNTWQADCALLDRQFVGLAGWKPHGLCGYGRIVGLVTVAVYVESPGLGRSPDLEVAIAEPNIFGGL
jgi:hypothetical protein